MYIQIINQTLSKHNQAIVQVTDLKQTSNVVINKIQQMGWDKMDCKTSQVRDELITTKYRGVDGKSIPNGRKQYKSRAKQTGTLNMKVNAVVSKINPLVVVD